MRTRNPDNRYRAINAATEPPSHVTERALWDLVHGGGTDKVVAYAHEIYQNLYEREILQAWLMARADAAAIHRCLRIPVPVIEAYQYLFFDVSMFRDELDVLSWAREYAQKKRGTDEGAQLLQKAIMGGVDALEWIYGRGQKTLDPHTVMHQVMTDTFMRGSAHRGQALGSKEAVAAHAQYKTAASLAEKLSKRGSMSGAHDLAIKLRHRDMTKPVDQIPQGDLLH